MKPKILQWLSLIIAICGGILAIGDTVTPIAALNPTLAHSWPLVLVLATAISRAAAIIADKIKASPALIIAISFAILANFSGCAGYTIGGGLSYTDEEGRTISGTGTVHKDAKVIKPVKTLD